jgi:hypothetical protein
MSHLELNFLHSKSADGCNSWRVTTQGSLLLLQVDLMQQAEWLAARMADLQALSLTAILDANAEVLAVRNASRMALSLAAS